MDYRQNTYYTNMLNECTDNTFDIEHLDEEGRSSPISSQTDSTNKKQRGGNFTDAEDSLLISAWLNISLDAVTGNEQKSRAYWLRVWEYFHKHKNFPSSRTQGSLMNRWSMLQQATNKFSACFAQIERLNQSGKTEKDKICDAKKLYLELYKTSFPFEHCWNELRYEAKWLQEFETKKQKRKKTATPATSTPSIADSVNLANDSGSPNNFVDLERPLGRKGEKDRLNKRKSKDRGNESFGEGSPVIVILKELKQEKMKLYGKKIEMLEKCYSQEQERLVQEQEKMQMEQLKEEERIMSMDTSGMPPLQAEYFQRRQVEILQQRN